MRVMVFLLGLFFFAFALACLRRTREYAAELNDPKHVWGEFVTGCAFTVVLAAFAVACFMLVFQMEVK